MEKKNVFGIYSMGIQHICLSNIFNLFYENSMKRKLISGLLLASVLFTGFIQTSCMGKFVLLKKLYGWNEKATGNKFLDNILFWILNIVPVYSIVVFVDAAILNLIEFWTGENPIAMNDGDRIERKMKNGNEEFLAIATKNKMEVSFGEADPRNFAIVFQPETRSWVLETKGKSICMAKELDNNQVALKQADGSTVVTDRNFSAKNLSSLVWQVCLVKN